MAPAGPGKQFDRPGVFMAITCGRPRVGHQFSFMSFSRRFCEEEATSHSLGGQCRGEGERVNPSLPDGTPCALQTGPSSLTVPIAPLPHSPPHPSSLPPPPPPLAPAPAGAGPRVQPHTSLVHSGRPKPRSNMGRLPSRAQHPHVPEGEEGSYFQPKEPAGAFPQASMACGLRPCPHCLCWWPLAPAASSDFLWHQQLSDLCSQEPFILNSRGSQRALVHVDHSYS